MGMRLQERDRQIFETIYMMDGVLSQAMLKNLYWKDKTWRAFWARLAQLVKAGFLCRTTKENRHRTPMPLVWLDVLGIGHICSQQGVVVDEVFWERALRHDTGKKLLRRALRKQGIRWKEPAYAQIDHHLAVNDLRIRVMEACELNRLRLRRWISEDEWRSEPHRVKVPGQQGTAAVIPDGYFLIDEGKDSKTGHSYMVEWDTGAVAAGKVVERHIKPGSIYLGSDQYIQRTGLRYGRYLVITSGPRRVANLARATEAAIKEMRRVNRNYFYFASETDVTAESLFTQPIWRQTGDDEPVSLQDTWRKK
jgi:hypothetical protein